MSCVLWRRPFPVRIKSAWSRTSFGIASVLGARAGAVLRAARVWSWSPFQTAVTGDPFTAGVVQVLLPVPVPSWIPAELPSSSGTCFRLAAHALDPAKIDRVTKRLGLGLDPRIVLLRHQSVTLAVPASSLPTRSVSSASSPWSRQTFPNSEVMMKHLPPEW